MTPTCDKTDPVVAYFFFSLLLNNFPTEFSDILSYLFDTSSCLYGGGEGGESNKKYEERITEKKLFVVCLFLSCLKQV